MPSSLPTLAVILLTVTSGGCKPGDHPPAHNRSAGPDRSTGAEHDATRASEDPAQRAVALARATILFDGHIDVAYRLTESRAADGSLTEEISERTAGGHFDYVRAIAGGLDGAFVAIYIPAELQDKPGASRKLADELLDLVEGIVAGHPDKFALVRSPDPVAANAAAGRVSLALGIENAAAIESDLANLQHFYDRGVRYITLTHSANNAIADSSYAEERRHHGLSEFGKQVIGEMNRLGILVDVSHVTDESVVDVLKVSRVPVIASHSSMRHFTPGFERNLSDELVEQIGAAGGIVMINFGSWFISEDNRKSGAERERLGRAWGKEHGLSWDDHTQREKILEHVDRELPPVRGTVEDVADHIDRAVELAGIDHVGLGSDFDGVMVLPTGLDDVSAYPNLIRVLLARGYSEQAIAKLGSGNLFRVWRAVEAYAASRATPAAPAR